MDAPSSTIPTETSAPDPGSGARPAPGTSNTGHAGDAPDTGRAGAARRLASCAIPLLCTLAGLAARLHGLGSKPFWLDEVTTLRRASLPFWAMVRDALSFHHLPAYFVITSWFLPFGNDELALRLPAALFGGLSCGLAAMVAGEIAGAGPALLAGTLMAVSPIEVQYGQEARSYTLVICAVLLALHGLVGLLRDPARASRPWRDRDGVRGAWLAYGLGTAGGLLVLGVALWWLLIANLAVAAIAWRQPGLPRAFRRRWLAVQAATVAVTAPGFVAMVLLVERAHGTFQSGLDWIPPLSWHHVGTGLASLYMLRVSSLIADRLFATAMPWFGPLVLLLAALGIVVLLRRRDRRTALALGVATVALPLVTALVSLVEPLFMPRYVLWSTGPFLVLAGIGLAVLPRVARLPAASLLAAVALLNLLPYYRTETKPRWEVAAHVLAERLRPGDTLLIADPGAVDMMNVFLARKHQAIGPELWTENVADASCALYAGRRVWALFGRVGQVDHQNLAGFLAETAPLGPPAASVAIGLDISLALYDHPAGPCVAQG